MTNFTNVFSGSVIRPAEVSYLPVTLTADITLEWPLESNSPVYPAAATIDVTSTVGAYAITLPDATQGSLGTAMLFNGLSANTQSAQIKDNAGTGVATLASGTQWLLVLAGTATTAGTWRAFQLGATTSAATAASLAGYGITASGGLLSQSASVTTFSSSPRTVLLTDRASLMTWTGAGSATFNLPAAATAGNNFFVMARNGGGGDLTVDPSGSELINGALTVALHPGDSALLVTDGIAWYSVGLGRNAAFAFDFTSISMASAAATYTLSGAELNRVSYKFTGLLTNDVAVVVPSTVQQYWVENATTGSYAVTLKTSGGTPVAVTQGGRDIYYSNGTNVVRATTGGIAIPIGVTDGGTGLASYAVGDVVYASGATTLGKLADVAIGNALLSGGVGVAPAYGKIGLTTHVSGTLPVANGGTGITALGTGVATALGVNVGSAGAVVTFNGALGTPSSGTATNLTGLPLTTGVTGTLGATNGGTGQATVTTGDIIYGSATNTWGKLADVATGSALISGGVGVAPSWGKIALTTHVSGTLPVANGGTGIASLGTGVATALGINIGSAGAFVTFNGALGTPSSGTAANLTGLPLTSGVTGTLPVVNGGTGVTSSTGTGSTVLSASPTFTGAPLAPTAAPGTNTTQIASTAFVTAAVSSSGGGTVTSVNASGGTTGLSFSGGPITSSGTLTMSGALAVANGGTGITAFGTGVATALGVNVGSAGAFVAFNGALGTPSSGTATNLTGLPLTTGVTGTLPVANGGTGITAFGTGVATALGVNIGSAGALVTFNGALGTPSSGTLTNATGLPLSSGISGLGTSVATALAVNVGSAGAVVTFGGALGTPSSGNLSSCTADGTRAVGTKRVPQLTTPTTFTSAIAGGHYYGASTVTINSGVFAVEDAFLIVNSGGSSMTITQGASVTLQLAGTATTGSRTLAAYGVASVLCVATDTFRVSGAGVT